MGLLDSEYPEWQKGLKNFSKNRWNGLQFSEYCLRWLGVRDRENQTKKLYFYWAIPGLFFFIFIFSMQLTLDKICRWPDWAIFYHLGDFLLLGDFLTPLRLSRNRIWSENIKFYIAQDRVCGTNLRKAGASNTSGQYYKRQ